jgi:hypothetical protein
VSEAAGMGLQYEAKTASIPAGLFNYTLKLHSYSLKFKLQGLLTKLVDVQQSPRVHCTTSLG